MLAYTRHRWTTPSHNQGQDGLTVPRGRFSGARLRDARQDAFLSQRELADRAKVGAASIARLEGDAIRFPHPRTLRKLAEALGVSPSAFFDEASDGATEETYLIQ